MNSPSALTPGFQPGDYVRLAGSGKTVTLLKRKGTRRRTGRRNPQWLVQHSDGRRYWVAESVLLSLSAVDRLGDLADGA